MSSSSSDLVRQRQRAVEVYLPEEVQGEGEVGSSVASTAAGSAASTAPDIASLVEKALAKLPPEMAAEAKDPKRKAKSRDPGWQFGWWPDIAKKDSVQCIFCKTITPSGIIWQQQPARQERALQQPGVSHDKDSKVSGADVVGQNDLLIVGPGVLGRIVAEKWQKEHPGCKVYGQTASTNHHSELTDLGIIPSLKGSTISQKVPHVIFCAPPSGSDDYPEDVRVAASNWNGEGSFLFTSSTALYDCSDNMMCNEDCPSAPIGRSPRTDVLLKVENIVLEAGGCVLRLAGLYKIDRGAHVFWLRKGTLDTRPDHIINQIHYEDAASLATAIMKKRLRNQIFLGCDNKPLSRQEIMDSVNRSGKFDTKFEGFTGTDGPLGKRMENSKTRAEIGWEPKYPSFTEFLGLSS